MGVTIIKILKVNYPHILDAFSLEELLYVLEDKISDEDNEPTVDNVFSLFDVEGKARITIDVY